MFLHRPQTRTAGADVVIVDAELLAPPLAPAPSSLESGEPPPQRSLDAVPSPAPRPPVSQAQRGILESGETSPERFGYLPFDQVDQAAEPVGDWVIDTDLLPRGVALRVVLQVWISAAGGIDRWELVGDDDSTAIARRALTDLARTPMQPAFLRQAPVASFRRLELLLQRE